MDALIYLYAALVVITALLALMSLRSARDLRSRLATMTLAAALMVVGYLGLLELLGRPKPMELQWPAQRLDDAAVLAAHLREGETIDLWLQGRGSLEPRSYRLPWNLERAVQLQRAMREAAASGTGLRMHRPVGDVAEQAESLFYAAPQPPLPEKADRTQ